MPSTFAHRIFGEKVLLLLPEKERSCLSRWRDRFGLGLHGPDLLFYYKALSRNRVNELGREMHDWPGLEFFRPIGEKLQSKNWPESSWAYLAGCLCHFALDYTCHGYVDEQAARGGPNHNEIELELDRALIRGLGQSPAKGHFIGHILPSKGLAEDAAQFFPGISPEEILESARSMRFIVSMVSAPSALERSAIDLALKISGNQGLASIVMPRQEDIRCRESTAWLIDSMDRAGELAERLILGFKDCVIGTRAFDEEYSYDFGSRRRLG